MIILGNHKIIREHKDMNDQSYDLITYSSSLQESPLIAPTDKLHSAKNTAGCKELSA